jgi:hypothetical protein
MTLQILVLTILLSSITSGFGIIAQNRTASFSVNSQSLHVSFDALPQRTMLYPPAYAFNLNATTSSGLWITNLHWDFGDGSTYDNTFSGRSQVTDIQNHIYSAERNYCVRVTATDNAGNTGIATVSVMPDFNITINPETQNATPGESASYAASVVSFCDSGHIWNSVLGTINLKASSSSDELELILSPSSGVTNFTATLKGQTTTTTPTGSYTIIIIGTSAGGTTNTATATLLVTPPPPAWFNLSAYPNSLTVHGNVRTNTTDITVKSFNDFNKQVYLSYSATPPLLVSFSPTNITPPANEQATSQATIVAGCDVTPGTYTINITGTSGALSKHTTVTVDVQECGIPGFQIESIVLGIVLGVVALTYFRRRQIRISKARY